MALRDQPARVQLGCGGVILVVLLVLLITALFDGDSERDEQLRAIRDDVAALRDEVRELRAELRVAAPAPRPEPPQP